MRQIANIYRVNRNHYLLKELNSTEVIIDKIMRSSVQSKKLKDFNIDDIKVSEREGILYYLYLYNSDEVLSDWKDFLPSELTEDQNFVQRKLSLVLFIQAENNLYAVIGGSSYQIIAKFIDHSFGLNTYAKIIKPELDDLASIKSRGITGARAGISEQFRNDYKIIDFMKFGKVPKEIHIKLSQEATNQYFKFLKTKSNERIQVAVSNGFKIKKDIDFNDLHKVILELEVIYQLAASEYLSSFKEITDQTLIESKLMPVLIKSIYDDLAFLNERSVLAKRFHHDFCNPSNIQKFYEADFYKLKEKSENGGRATFKTVTNRDEIYESVLLRAVEKSMLTYFDFRSFINGVMITCYKDGKATKNAGFIHHFSAEFIVDSKPVFLVDTKWYQLRDSFVEDLKIGTAHILKTRAAPKRILNLPWDKSAILTEKAYNLQYNGQNNYIVLDTIIVDGIELCDILCYDEENLYLAHVKYGFNAKVRELGNQITISAKRLKDAIGSGNSTFFDTIYNRLIEKEYSVNGLSQNEFRSLFEKDKITYILAFTSHLNDEVIADNIDKFDSNIARYSLNNCSVDMRANYYDLLVHQIPRV